MQKKKIITKSIIKFFTKNLLSVFGMIMLVLFSSAVFTTLNNATNNLNESYKKVTKNGNLHDFVINEKFTLGNSNYVFVPNSGIYDSLNETYSYAITPLIGSDGKITWTNSYLKIFNDYQSWKSKGEPLDKFFTQNKFLFEENRYVSTGHPTEPSQSVINNLVLNSISDQLLQLEILTTNYMPVQYITDIEEATPTSLRNFKSINIPTNKQKIFYKVIESSRNNLIDKIVLFEGKDLSNPDSAFSGLFSFYSNLLGDKSDDISAGRKIVEMLAQVDWNDEKRVNEFNAFNNFIKDTPDSINPWTITIPSDLPNPEKDLVKRGQNNFKKIIDNKLYKEKGFSIIFDENNQLSPVTGVIEDKSSYEAIVTPQYLSKNKKEIFSYSEWMLHQNDPQKDFLEWFNKIDDKYKISIDEIHYLIIGSGISPDFIYPVLSNERIIPDLSSETFFYTNSSGFSKVQDSFRNSEIEAMILGEFNPNVSNKNDVIKQINNLSRTLMDWPSNMDAAFFADDLNNTITPSALRVIFIPNVMNIITLVSYFLTSFITFISIVISVLFIKRFLDLNKVNLGILQANGYKKSDIVIPMIICMGLLIVIGTAIGFNLGLILQSPVMLIFQSFWTLPVEYTAFNGISFLIFLIGLVSFYALITFGITLFSLKGDNVYLMKSEAQYKGNLLSKGSKKIFKNSNPLNKFRISLAYHSISKLLLLSVMTSLIMTSLIFASSTYGKFEDARISTFASRQYKYDLKLFTPTNVSGQYYAVPIDSIGMTLVEGKYENLRSYTTEELDGFIEANPDSSLITIGDVLSGPPKGPYNVFSEIRDKDDPTIKDPTFQNLYENGNWHLPSISDVTSQNNIDYLKEKTQNRALLDVSILGNNPWEIAARLMPTNQKNYADSSFKNLLSSLTIDDSTFEIVELTDSSKIGTFNPSQKASDSLKKFTENSTKENINSFENLVEDDDPDNDYLIISKPKIMSKFSPLLIDHEFISLLLHAYSNINTASENYTLNYNKVPLKTDGENVLDETYTNVDFSIVKNKNQNIDIVNNNFSMQGIKLDTNFVSLVNLKNQNLIKKLDDFEFDPLNKVYPIVINGFTAKEFNLSEGDTIEIEVKNHVNRYDKPNINFDKLIVIGISESFQNNEFFTLQKYGNILTGMDTLKKDFTDPNNEFLNSDEPFNAIFSNSDEVVQITNTISLYSPSGLYPKEDRTDNNAFLQILQKTNYSNLIEASKITGIDENIINDPSFSGLSSQEKLKIAQEFQRKITEKYGEQTYVSLLSNIISTDALLSLFQNVSDISGFIEIVILLITILVSTIIIGLIIYMLISDSLKIAGMMKILGLKNTTNALSFMSIYFVAIFVGIIISIPLSFFVNFLFTKIIFDSASILLIAPILFSDYAIASLSVIGFFFLAFLLNWRKIKKLDLTKNIK